MKAAVPRDSASRFSTIVRLIIKGLAADTTSAGDLFGIVAEQIVSAKIRGIASQAPGVRKTRLLSDSRAPDLATPTATYSFGK